MTDSRSPEICRTSSGWIITKTVLSPKHGVGEVQLVWAEASWTTAVRQARVFADAIQAQAAYEAEYGVQLIIPGQLPGQGDLLALLGDGASEVGE